MLVAFSREQALPEVASVSTRDQMDDGTPICLTVTIDRRDGSAVFDFEGAGGRRLAVSCAVWRRSAPGCLLSALAEPAVSHLLREANGLRLCGPHMGAWCATPE